MRQDSSCPKAVSSLVFPIIQRVGRSNARAPAPAAPRGIFEALGPETEKAQAADQKIKGISAAFFRPRHRASVRNAAGLCEKGRSRECSPKDGPVFQRRASARGVVLRSGRGGAVQEGKKSGMQPQRQAGISTAYCHPKRRTSAWMRWDGSYRKTVPSLVFRMPHADAGRSGARTCHPPRPYGTFCRLVRQPAPRWGDPFPPLPPNAAGREPLRRD